MMKICIVIPSFGDPNKAESLVVGLTHCLKESRLTYKILIINNGLFKSIKESTIQAGKVEVVNPGRNLYYVDSLKFALLNNDEYDYFALLNDDLLVTSEFGLAKAVERLEWLKSKNIEAICCPAVLISNSENKVNSTGLYRKGPIYVCRDYLRNYAEVKTKRFYATHNVSGATLIGSANNFTRILKTMGKWNCMYLEDVAIGISASRLNIKQFCFADMHVYHEFSPVISNKKKIIRYIKGYCRFLKFLIAIYCLDSPQ